MGDVVMVVLTVVLMAGVLAGLPLLARRVRARGVGGGLMGPFDEVWHPAAHRARVEVETQQERRAPAPSPGDPPGKAPQRDCPEPRSPEHHRRSAPCQPEYARSTAWDEPS